MDPVLMPIVVTAIGYGPLLIWEAVRVMLWSLASLVVVMAIPIAIAARKPR